MKDDDQFDLFPLRHLVHSNGLDTERAALQKVAPSLRGMRHDIYRELLHSDEDGITPDQYSETYGKLINTVRRRFTDLWKDGFIRHHPELKTRANKAGNECVLWVIGKDPRSNLRAETRIRRLREQLKTHGITPCC